jgi:hypothetical protein
MKKHYFRANVSQYVQGKDDCVYRPSLLSNPKDGAVLFITPEYMYSRE